MKTITLMIFLLSNTIIGLGQNLISNSSFSDNLELLCEDWYDACGNELTISCDTTMYCQVTFVSDPTVPTYTDSWVLQLDAGFPQEGFAETYIIGQNGTYIYQLKYYMRSDTTLQGDNSAGFVSIGIGTQNQFIASKTESDTTSTWKEFSFIDTLTTQITDTITVRLSAESCDFCIRKVNFKYIELTIIDTLTAIQDRDTYDKINIKAFPNPASDNITIQIDDNNKNNYNLTVYSSTGQHIKTIRLFKNSITFDNEYFAKGLYLYQIQSTIDKKVIGRGKFIIQ